MMVLFQDGDWRLIVASTSDQPIGRSDIQHRCRPSSRIDQWWYYCAYIQCGACNKFIPDELRGLKDLYDWDR